MFSIWDLIRLLNEKPYQVDIFFPKMEWISETVSHMSNVTTPGKRQSWCLSPYILCSITHHIFCTWPHAFSESNFAVILRKVLSGFFFCFVLCCFFSFLTSWCLETYQFQSLWRKKGLLPGVCWICPPQPPHLLYVKCLIIKKYRFYTDTEAFQYEPHFQEWLLCVDVLAELDFCGLDFNCPV